MKKQCSLSDTLGKVCLTVYEEKEMIIKELKVNKNTWKSYSNGTRSVPMSLLLEVANNKGITIDGILEGKKVPNPNPYNVNKSFENFLSAIEYTNKNNKWQTKSSEGKEGEDNKTEDKPKKTKENKDIDFFYTANRYFKEGSFYTQKNMRVAGLIVLSEILEVSAEDILRGNFEKITKKQNDNVAQEAEVVQK